MATALNPPLSADERAERRRLLVRDTAALVSLLAFTVVLFLLTLVLFRAFTRRRADLGQRWLARGQLALQQGHPEQAIDSLRAALQYSPGQRPVEIELAKALAAAGRPMEATAYFNTLWEAEPGDGDINLQLARLASRQGEQSIAIQDYHAAIYGTWEGDGSIRRREVRLELVQYLLGLNRYYEARNELLIAAGNAPDDPAVKLKIASLLEAAHDNGDASALYRYVASKADDRHTADPQALEGAGRTAFALGEYQQARGYLERALNHPTIAAETPAVRAADENMLRDAVQILLLYPSPSLPPRALSERVLHLRSLAEARFEECLGGANGPGANAQIASLAARWAVEPQTLSAAQLARNPQQQQAEIQLAYDTEKLAADPGRLGPACGPPAGDDALLVQIARAPEEVERQ